jgi:hypothetical protein
MFDYLSSFNLRSVSSLELGVSNGYYSEYSKGLTVVPRVTLIAANSQRHENVVRMLIDAHHPQVMFELRLGRNAAHFRSQVVRADLQMPLTTVIFMINLGRRLRNLLGRKISSSYLFFSLNCTS